MVRWLVVSARRLPLLCAWLAVWLVATGCYTRFQHVADVPFPEPVRYELRAGSVGITQNVQSTAATGVAVAPEEVVARLSRRLAEDRVFEPVIHPYTARTRSKPAVVLDATVRIALEPQTGPNRIRSLVHGASFFLMAPFVPQRAGFVVDLSVTAFLREEMELIGTYAFTSEYELAYTALEPSEAQMSRWVDRTIDHAVEEVLNQLKRDRSGFPTAMAPL